MMTVARPTRSSKRKASACIEPLVTSTCSGSTPAARRSTRAAARSRPPSRTPSAGGSLVERRAGRGLEPLDVDDVERGRAPREGDGPRSVGHGRQASGRAKEPPDGVVLREPSGNVTPGELAGDVPQPLRGPGSLARALRPTSVGCPRCSSKPSGPMSCRRGCPRRGEQRRQCAHLVALGEDAVADRHDRVRSRFRCGSAGSSRRSRGARPPRGRRAAPGQAALQLEREQQVGELGLPVGPPAPRSRRCSQLRSSRSIPPVRWAPEETVTTRSVTCGSSRLVSAKWPRWFVPNCSSKPSAVRPCGGGHHAGVVDQHVEVAVPAVGERADRGEVGEVERADLGRRRASSRRPARPWRCRARRGPRGHRRRRARGRRRGRCRCWRR